jgi:hypothetical protein
MASKAVREEDKRTWLELAEKWRLLAIEAGRGAPQQAEQPQGKRTCDPEKRQ